jgi:GntR family transcriptional regulator/MocR family aminotransferase
MPDSWANSGVDLMLELTGSHRREAVEDALRDAVRSGRLTAGTPLPSSRALAGELGLARNTVADAYGQLVAEGWLTARQGSGTRVAERASATARRPAQSVPVTPAAAQLLRPGLPDLSGFPRSAWLSAGRRALGSAPNNLLGYPDPRGLLSLREALSEYLARARGVRTTPDTIMICSGFLQALQLLSTTLRRRGTSAMSVEAYGLGQHRDLIRAAGLATVAVGLDSFGARTDELESQTSGAILLTPSHQFPLGVPLSPPRRTALLRWARQRSALVIEDDYDGEFRYDRKPVGALQGLAPELVAYVGTASKSLAPGLGLAWLVLPPWLLPDLIETKRQSDGYTGVFEQLTLNEFIRSGAYDRHVRRSRLRYRRRRDLLVETLAARAPQVRVSGIAAGLHAVLRLPGRPVTEEPAIRTRAARAGLDLHTLSHFRYEAGPEPSAALVIGYAAAADHAYNGALEALCDAIAPS